MYNVSRKKNIFKLLLFVLTLIVIALAVLFVLEKTGKTNIVSNPFNNQAKPEAPAQTTSKQPSAQSTFSGGQPRKEATQSNINEGTVTDNNGLVSNVSNESTWIKSSDGASIIVYSPITGQVLKSGDALTGSSTASKVFFRLIDNVSGMIASGSVNVVNGKFSGTFNFATDGNEGQVDVFTTNADGVESNNVSIPLRFK